MPPRGPRDHTRCSEDSKTRPPNKAGSDGASPSQKHASSKHRMMSGGPGVRNGSENGSMQTRKKRASGFCGLSFLIALARDLHHRSVRWTVRLLASCRFDRGGEGRAEPNESNWSQGDRASVPDCLRNSWFLRASVHFRMAADDSELGRPGTTLDRGRMGGHVARVSGATCSWRPTVRAPQRAGWVAGAKKSAASRAPVGRERLPGHVGLPASSAPATPGLPHSRTICWPRGGLSNSMHPMETSTMRSR